MISLLGWAAWPVIKWGIPALSPKVTITLIVMALAIIAMGAPTLAVYIHMRGEVKQAELRRDAEWRDHLDKASRDHDLVISDAIATAESVVLEDDAAARSDPNHADRMCDADRYCRDRGQKRR